MALTSGGKLAERLVGRPEAAMFNVECWILDGGGSGSHGGTERTEVGRGRRL